MTRSSINMLSPFIYSLTYYGRCMCTCCKGFSVDVEVSCKLMVTDRQDVAN